MKESQRKAIHARKNASPKGIYLIPNEPNKFYTVSANGSVFGNAHRGNPNGLFSFLKRKIVGNTDVWTGEHELLERKQAFEKIKKEKLRKVDSVNGGSLDLTRN